MRYFSVKNCVNNDVSFVIFGHKTWDLEGGGANWIYVRKSREKKFLEKNLEIKTLEKSSNFIKSLEKMSEDFFV